MKNSIAVTAIAVVSLAAGIVIGGSHLTSAVAGLTPRAAGSGEEYITDDADGSSITIWSLSDGKVTKAVKHGRYNKGELETTVYEAKKSDGK